MARTPTVAIGDRFTRTGQLEKVYVVTGIRTKPGEPSHAQLALEGGGGPILIGLSALTDRSLYQRVQP
ncbi:hypothetical protein [Azospirillum sp. sgz301742]